MIYYFCFYSGPKSKGLYEHNFGASSKIEYIIKELSNYDEVTVISFIKPMQDIRTKNFFSEKIENLKNPVTVNYIYTRKFKHKISNKIYQTIIKRSFFNSIINKIDSNDIILFYHSLYFLKYERKFSSRFEKQSVIQIEDIYSITFADRFPKLIKLKSKEISTLKSFEYAICITDYIADLIHPTYYVISNGVLEIQGNINKKFSTSETIILYAGIIDRTFNAAFNAVNIVKNLPHRFKLYICGNGSSEDIDYLQALVNRINKQEDSERFHFLGLLSGDELNNIYSVSHIGISVENFGTSLERQKYSFHSKLLRYLSYGIPVICTNYESELTCSLSDVMIFVSPEKSPKEIAKLILNTKFPSEEQIKKRVLEEYSSFKNNFCSLFEQIKENNK